MTYKNLKLEKKDGVSVVYINSPEKLNVLNYETLSEFSDLLAYLNGDGETRVVVITGYGRAFSAGADVKEMSEMDEMKAGNFSTFGQDVTKLIEHLDKPVIAAINGYALGGGNELAMACDVRIAVKLEKDGKELKYIGQPETNLGIIPGFGGTQRLARLVGESKAKELIYTGNSISASEAYDIGLVDRVVEPEKLMDEAMDIAKKIAVKSKTAIKLSKRAIHEGLDLNLKSGLDLEAQLFGKCFADQEAKKCMKAFLEKQNQRGNK